MFAKVDQDTCIGCGLCVSMCPDVFTMDDGTNTSVAIADEIPGDSIDCAKEAEDSCPVSAIVIS